MLKTAPRSAAKETQTKVNVPKFKGCAERCICQCNNPFCACHETDNRPS